MRLGRSASRCPIAGQVTVPSVGASRPASRCSSVDFPDPEGPVTAMLAPAKTSHVVGCSATTARGPWPNVRAAPSQRATGRGSVIPPPRRRAVRARGRRRAATRSLWVTTTTAAPARRALAQQHEHALGRGAVELARGLVAEQDVGVVGQRDRQPGASALTAGELARQGAGAGAEADGVEDLRHRRRGAVVAQALGQANVAGDGRGGRRGWRAGRARRCGGRGCGRAPPRRAGTGARRRSRRCRRRDRPGPRAARAASISRARRPGDGDDLPRLTARLTPRRARVSSSPAW